MAQFITRKRTQRRVQPGQLYETYRPTELSTSDRRAFLRRLGYLGLGCGLATLLTGVVDTEQAFAAMTTMNTIPQSYTIFADAGDGNLIKARNGSTNAIDYSNADAAHVIQYAINAMTSGGKIMLQAGTYLISTGLLSNGVNGIEMYGEGDSTVLRLANTVNSPVLYLESVKDWYIHHMQIDGNKSSQSPTSKNSDGINAYLCSNLVLDSNYVHDCRTHGLRIGAGTDCKILNNRVLNSGANGITVANGDGGARTLVQGNTVNGASDVGISTWTGIDVTIANNTVMNVTANESPYALLGIPGCNSHVGIMQEESSQRISVNNNYIQNCENGLSNAPSPGQLNTDVTWQGNQVYDCKRAMSVNNAARTSIISNQIARTMEKGIYVDSQASAVQITGNGLQDIGGNSAIEAAANGLLIDGNDIRRVAGDCIVAWGQGNWVVTGNNIDSTTKGGCGILLGSGSNNWNVARNTINACSGDGIRIGGASSYNTVNGNQISSCATAVNINSPGGKSNVITSNIFQANKNNMIDSGTGTVKSNNVVTTIVVKKR